MHIKRCEQCGKMIWAERSTRKTCSNACKQRKKRGVPYQEYYDIWDDAIDRKMLDTLELIADKDKQAFAKLQRMRDKYGRNAMLAAVSIIVELGG